MTPKEIVEGMRQSVKNRDKMGLVYYLKNLILLFYPDPDSHKDLKEVERGLDYHFKTLGATSEKDLDYEYKRLGITGLIEAVEKEDDFTFYFFSGTAGERFYFDGRNQKLMYTGGIKGNRPLKRFIELFGGDSISLQEIITEKETT